ncbi:MAG: DNA/RNA nuclease SfsA [Clostridiales bacterium]|jgi:sugar fermentation stimulation protein A|nr:DNA/RNA nuclease SfsA [Clostridiales bacterium]
MIYNNIHEGIFLNRPNRFIAEVLINNVVEICHVKNTGRCKELLTPGVKVILNKSDNPKRATKYDLISVYKGERLINMDSQAPNIAFGEYLKSGAFIDNLTLIKPEVKYGQSRFDFYVEAGDHSAFIEVKGVTLEDNGIVMFPDAPTLRGVKHLNELVSCMNAGYGAYAVFIIQMENVDYFTPNYKTHPEFGEALKHAVNQRVKAVAFDCKIDRYSMVINKEVPLRFNE